MAWAASLLAGTGGQVAGILAGGAVLVLIAWLLIRLGRRHGLGEARQSDVELRAAMEKASHGGYSSERERLEGLDPITGRPPDGELRRPGNPGAGPA